MISNLQYLEYFFPLLDNGGIPKWIGDSFCDDANNIEYCDYDRGDCCGLDVLRNFCLNCTCTGRCKLFWHV